MCLATTRAEERFSRRSPETERSQCTMQFPSVGKTTSRRRRPSEKRVPDPIGRGRRERPTGGGGPAIGGVGDGRPDNRTNTDTGMG